MSKLEYRAIQELRYKSGQIDRRTFVRSLLATGVVLPSALSLAGQVAAATPKSGGLFRMGVATAVNEDKLGRGTEPNRKKRASAKSEEKNEPRQNGQIQERKKRNTRQTCRFLSRP
jgi:hypothetical protein